MASAEEIPAIGLTVGWVFGLFIASLVYMLHERKIKHHNLT